MKVYVQDHYRLRPLTVADWLGYKDIRLKALKTDPHVFGANFDRESQYTPQQWKATLSDPTRAYFGLFADDVLVGFTGVLVDGRDDRRCVLVSSFIKLAHRGKNLSGLFYRARLDWARARGMTQAMVSHRISNKVSQAANQKFGFKYMYQESKKWPDGVEADEVFTRWTLSPMRKYSANDYEVRLFRPEEWQALKVIRLEALREYPDRLNQPYAVAAQKLDMDWQVMLADQNKVIFAVLNGQEIIGYHFVALQVENKAAGSNGSYIRRRHNWRGIDKLLYEAAIDWAKMQCCTSFRASCKETNLASIRLFEKYGGEFVFKGDEEEIYPDGSRARTVHYALNL